MLLIMVFENTLVKGEGFVLPLLFLTFSNHSDMF